MVAQPSAPRVVSSYSHTPFTTPARTTVTNWPGSSTIGRSLRRAKARASSTVGTGASSIAPSRDRTIAGSSGGSPAARVLPIARRWSTIASVWFGWVDALVTVGSTSTSSPSRCGT